MKTQSRVERDIVLIGGGHAHVEVLRRFGMSPQPGTRVTLISREVSTPYSGMLPGHLAGHYTFEESHIDLRPLCRRVDARLFHSEVTELDLAARRVICADRPPVHFDYLSLDIGSTPQIGSIGGAEERAIPIKPVSRFLDRWAELEERARSRPQHVVIVGGGAGGVEVALSLHHRASTAAGSRGGRASRFRFTVVTDEQTLLPLHAPSVQRRMRDALQRRSIELHTGRRVVEVLADRVRCEPALEIACDAALVVTNAAAPAWLRDTGLDLDEQGFINVRDTLQAIGHQNVFAAGDVASFPTPLLKNGVYAVRQGPVLSANLRALAAGREPISFAPQRRTLALVSTGDRHAIASYGAASVQGEWVWRLKDWIDRRWMRRYQDAPLMNGEAVEMRCGGCGAKVGDDILRGVLRELRPKAGPEVAIGLANPDDAAAVEAPPGMLTVQTVDQFRSFIDDAHLFGRIAALHCLSDIYGMGAEPRYALAMVTLANASPLKMREELHDLLSGALAVLEEEGAALIGGHTGEGAELSFGLCVTGFARRDSLLHKTGLALGDALVLSKPLGTGAILAADMRGLAKNRWLEGALECMNRSNRAAAAVLKAQGASACTDVTGFGLLGHLREMLRGSAFHVALSADEIPLLEGAAEMVAAGVTSTLQPANERHTRIVTNPGAIGSASLLFDPQTSGGLLAGVPADRAERCVAALRAAGCPAAALIGRVVEGEPGRVSIAPAAAR